MTFTVSADGVTDTGSPVSDTDPVIYPQILTDDTGKSLFREALRAFRTCMRDLKCTPLSNSTLPDGEHTMRLRHRAAFVFAMLLLAQKYKLNENSADDAANEADWLRALERDATRNNLIPAA